MNEGIGVGDILGKNSVKSLATTANHCRTAPGFQGMLSRPVAAVGRGPCLRLVPQGLIERGAAVGAVRRMSAVAPTFVVYGASGRVGGSLIARAARESGLSQAVANTALFSRLPLASRAVARGAAAALIGPEKKSYHRSALSTGGGLDSAPQRVRTRRGLAGRHATTQGKPPVGVAAAWPAIAFRLEMMRSASTSTDEGDGKEKKDKKKSEKKEDGGVKMNPLPPKPPETKKEQKVLAKALDSTPYAIINVA